MSKTRIKLLFDMTQFQYFYSNKKTGIYRAADEIFKKLAARDDVDLYCFVDCQRSYHNILEYLKTTNPAYLEKIILLEHLSKISKKRNFIYQIRSRIYSVLYAKKYTKIIGQFDWYFSPFNAISAIIYQNIKTSILVHDIIPILFPELVNQKNVKKFTKFIDDIKADFVFFDSSCSRDDFLNYRQSCGTNFDPQKTAITLLAASEKFYPILDKNLIKQKIQKYHIGSTKYLAFIPSGYGNGAQAPPRLAGIPIPYALGTNGKYFLSVSDFNPRKNILFIIKNFLSFIKENQINDLSLVLCGPNRNLQQKLLNNFPEHQNLFSKIIFTGFVDDEDLPFLYNGAMALVYMSLYEGFGLPPLEAMQSGIPVITSNNSSLPEVVGDTAIMVNPADNNGLLLAFKLIYDDELLRKNLSQKGIARAKNFSWDKTVGQMAKVFNQ